MPNVYSCFLVGLMFGSTAPIRLPGSFDVCRKLIDSMKVPPVQVAPKPSEQSIDGQLAVSSVY